MSLFRRAPEPEPLPEPDGTVEEPAAEPARWGGAVCFGDGWYHPVIVDAYNEEIGPDLTRKLVWKEDQNGGYYEFARPDDRSHFETYGRADTILEPTSEVQV